MSTGDLYSNADNYGMGFTSTHAYYELKEFIEDIDYKIQKTPDEKPRNESFLSILQTISNFIDETDLDTGSHRFANSAAVKVFNSIENLDLSKFFNKAIDELDLKIVSFYVKRSFGNKIRLDYGTGHEVFFLSSLYVARCLELVTVDETQLIFQNYFEVVRKFIYKYNLEPAGSNGLFAVDDYHFLPFLFGSAELMSTEIKFEELFEEKNKNLMYAQAINFCAKHKCKYVKRPFEKHSQVIYEMRNMSWLKVNEEIFDMILEKVFASYVVMQHFVYCRYLRVID